jgi:acetoin utilization deacetylase AcuC-like enzyme
MLEQVPEDIRQLYHVFDWRHAAAILASDFPDEFSDICEALRSFRFTEAMVRKAGGNESGIPKTMSAILRPRQWKDAKLKARLLIDETEVSQDTHKIDYVKGQVAFDLEWNSKDQTFDRDLYAFRAFWEYGRISVGILLTRGQEMVPYLRALGKEVLDKYGGEGGSTTHWNKLMPRLQAGRGGGCPVLVLGITPRLVTQA